MDLLFALSFIAIYISLLVFIVKMTAKIANCYKDPLARTHLRSKYEDWLFIIDPLVEWRLQNA
jgi:hypothetical protein